MGSFLLRIRGYLVAHSSESGVFLDFLADPIVLLCCRYFAETKTLWEHLNSPAATIQLLRPGTMHVLVLSLLL